MFLVNM